MRRSAEDAKARILQAAQAEFALYGVTGARIDRIAREAGASKERLYAYFGDKQRLFDEVIRAAMEHVYNAVRIEGHDLIAYTGHLVEHFFKHPDDLRMLSWTRLEEQCERALNLDAVTAHHAEKAAVVRQAQEAGLVDPVWDPDELLQLILVTATYWASASGSSAESPARYRAVAEEAVRRLVEPKR
jgi:AcrR family transcriptional regulator